MSEMEVPLYVVVQSSCQLFFFNIVNECATLLVCILKNVTFAAVLLRLLYAMFIIYTSRI